MTLLPEFKKPSRLRDIVFAVFAIVALGMVIAMGVQNKRLTVLEQSLLTSPDESRIDALQMRQIDLSEQLEMIVASFDHAQTVASADLQELSSSVDLHFAQMQAQLSNAQPDLSAIHEQLNTLDERINYLSERLSKIIQQAVPVARHSPVKPSQNTTRPTLPEPTFMLLGAEMRGGERLLSVAPKANASLANARLIHVGETIDDWLLQSFDGAHAIFEHNSQVRKLSVPGSHP